MKDTRITELEQLIQKHQKLYYNGEAEISDFEFDKLWDELKQIDPENSMLHRVGVDSSQDFQKTKHIIPMGSQEKAANQIDFLAWTNRMNIRKCFTQYKLDGASIELQYEVGKFSKAVTRGDGVIGDDITSNVRKMKGVVFDLHNTFTGAIRGEILMSHVVHQTYFKDKANCRNAANGLMKRKNGDGSEHLEIIVYDAMSTTIQPFTDELRKIEWLKNCGFTVVESVLLESPQDVIVYRDKVMEIRKDLPYDIDGLVIKNISINLEDMKRDRPQYQIAFKFTLEEAVTTLTEVEWTINGSTRTPVGIFDEVYLAGTTVSRANLCNPDTIAYLNIKLGSKIVVTKRGEIIPKIERVVESCNKCRPIEIPKVCTVCGSNLINSGTILYCPNENCPEVTIHRINKWISTLDIQNLGPQTVTKLYNAGLVRSIKDLYTVTVDQISNLDRMGVKSAERIIESIQDAKALTLSAFISGFDLDGVGETVISYICDAGYNTFEKIKNMTLAEYTSIRNIGEITARTIMRKLQTHIPEMTEILENGYVEIVTIGNQKLSGKSFCFTGELVSMKRGQAEAQIKALGGTAKGSVTSDLTYLVTNNPTSGSSKNQKARELGVTILDEEQFLKLLQS